MASLHPFPTPTSLLVLMFLALFSQVSCLPINYTTFEDRDMRDFIHHGNSRIYYGALQITTDTGNRNYQHLMKNSSGRLLYKDTIKLWKKKKNGTVIASFHSTFALNIVGETENSGPPGEGLAFILTSNPELPMNSHGQWLGIVNSSLNGSPANRIVAIEFDTRKSHMGDEDDNHVGINVNSINSNIQVPLKRWGVNLSSGVDVVASIRYDGISKNMTVNVSMFNDTTSHHIITETMDLSEHLPEDVYIGFSGSTSNYTQLNCITKWNFSIDEIAGKNKMWIVWVLLGILLPLLLCCGLTSYLCWRRKIKSDVRLQELLGVLENSTKGPHKFRLKDLKSATANFHPKNKLGQGGFGTVYKGFLKGINKDVAVKRLSKDSSQGEQEFVAEVKTISRLRHRNLVHLIGWCYESGEFLLVYEYLPRGSLDKLLFYNDSSVGTEILLSWDRRHKMIQGVASALSYLHDGCDRRVLHRDVKSSNVMLDNEYKARLGDFGLARTVQYDGGTHHSTSVIAGTPGYIAPEYYLTGRASAETDVYGFGVFAIEVTCGRPPGNDGIVDWLWGLYGREKLLDAVDPQMHGGFEEEQVGHVLTLGLACCHPNPNERPSMRVVLQMLTGEAGPPIPPNEKPAFMWPAVGRLHEAVAICIEEHSID
ncbi:probable L-type lectin-domain containing receptor kinase S.5 [Magnolia sinica]|uniref:probable L-type lectin-domain containing receptor kinase S.5 n=1 Tax=Magnolia sinica TaxID=86752 RepID=UPI0026591F7F|nr:probable L-type lectin-domain containing receptor kinase S.5 [Magnolia sinica]